MQLSRIAIGVLFAVCLTISAVGCGESDDSMTTIRGKITKGGQPLQVDKAKYGNYAAVTATLEHLSDAGGQPLGVYTAAVDENGEFELEVPPGTFRVAVSQLEGRGNDLLGGKFAPGNSPITREITDSTQELAIDLDNLED